MAKRIALATLVVLALGADLVRAQDLGALKQEYRRVAPKASQDATIVELGRELFFDARLSASGKTSCASCHFRELGWGVKDPRSRNDAGKLTSRKSQPLIGVGHIEGPLGWDGRNVSLEAQAKSSIAAGSMSLQGTEKPVKLEAIEERVQSDNSYVARFEAAFPGRRINMDGIVSAIAAFERTLEPDVAPFDRWVEGDEQAISDAAKRGLALFAGKANCFACHSGWRFTDDRFHDIGTSTTDRGRGNVLKGEEDAQFAFKTPTLRSVALRPPYMHNSMHKTLQDVIAFYVTGGIDRPSRSPMMMPIELSADERADLVAFLETLSGEGEPQRRSN
jgi:cytochrome c peroxidase